MTYDKEREEAVKKFMQDTKAKDYTMKITVPAEKMMGLAYDIMCNYPEASFCLKCIGWKYKEGIFIFYDEEEDKRYTVTTQQIAEKGLPVFIDGLLNKKWHFDGMAAGDLLDAGNYDACATDGVLQCALFGDVIYG